ncbi:MAG: D-hexose-6-phosphate mutarotase, partial [Betaproteobacteria bacterium]
MALAKLTEFDGHPAVALRAADGARATILLHGGHLVSWIPQGGDEQLYLSPTSQYGEGQAVRGGVPVIFPQFSSRGTLPRHGLVRTRGWQLGDTASHGQHAQAVLRFVADDATRALWPHEFEAEITVSI